MPSLMDVCHKNAPYLHVAQQLKDNNKRTLQVTGSDKSLHDPVSMYEDESMASMKEKLARAQEARDTLSAENVETKVKIHSLQQHRHVFFSVLHVFHHLVQHNMYLSNYVCHVRFQYGELQAR
ncbi:uncharacterized protein [Dysidea avara]|uniref:uncharacterized protein n=1 Tax=Dysidea avara TaxID=196820 RepID=UPI003318E4A6